MFFANWFLMLWRLYSAQTTTPYRLVFREHLSKLLSVFVVLLVEVYSLSPVGLLFSFVVCLHLLLARNLLHRVLLSLVNWPDVDGFE